MTEITNLTLPVELDSCELIELHLHTRKEPNFRIQKFEYFGLEIWRLLPVQRGVSVSP